MIIKRGILYTQVFILMVSFLWLPLPAFAQQGDKVMLEKIAEITSIEGKVLARTKMKWVVVNKTPYPVYNGDHIVTRRGKAEIMFNDVSVLRLGLESNVKIFERKITGGLIRKQVMVRRNIKMAMGHIYVNMKKWPNYEIRFETPTLIIDFKGTEFTVVKSPGERDKLGTNEPEKLIVHGSADPLPSDKWAIDLEVPLEPGAAIAERGGTNLQGAAGSATEKENIAKRASEKFARAESRKEDKRREFERNPTEGIKTELTDAEQYAALKQVEAARDNARAEHANSRYAYEWDKIWGGRHVVEVEENIQEIEGKQVNIDKDREEVESLIFEIADTDSPDKALALSMATDAVSNTAEINQVIAGTLDNLNDAIVNENREAEERITILLNQQEQVLESSENITDAVTNAARSMSEDPADPRNAELMQVLAEGLDAINSAVDVSQTGLNLSLAFNTYADNTKELGTDYENYIYGFQKEVADIPIEGIGMVVAEGITFMEKGPSEEELPPAREEPITVTVGPLSPSK